MKVPILAILERATTTRRPAGSVGRALLGLVCLLPLLLGLAHEVRAGGDGAEGAQPTGTGR